MSTPWGNQCFRFKNPQIENKKINVRAQHIYFDSENYIIKDSFVVDKNCNDGLDHLNMATDVSTSFTTISDVPTIFSYRCVRKSLAEAVNDVIERWGGHLVRNNWQIEVRQNAGQDRGVNLVYGKNIVNITSSEDWPDVCTKLMPVGKDGLLLDETWLSIDEQLYDIPYTKAQSFEQNEINQKDYSDGEGNSDEAAYKELDKYADITSNTADSVGKLDKEMGALKNELDAGRLFKRHFRRWRYNFCKTSKMQN